MGDTVSSLGVRPRLGFAYRPSAVQGVFSEACLAKLAATCDVVSALPMQTFDDSHAQSVLPQIDVLMTGWGCPKIDAATLERAPRLKLIAHAAGSVKGFVGLEVFERRIAVTNAASANAIPVAEYTLAAIIFANKQVLRYRDAYRESRDRTRRDDLSQAKVGNWKKTIGIVGASRIGRRVIELLRGFDFTVLLYDPYADPASLRGLDVRQVDLDELLRSSDVVSLHAPSLDSTRGMIDARALSQMRDGATLINTARGALVDQAALERELIRGRISAVIDVSVPEVLPKSSPLYELPNVLLTPHIAGALGGERERLGLLAAEEIERFAAGEPLRYAISAAELPLQA